MHLTPVFFEETTDQTEIETIIPGQDLGIIVVATLDTMQKIATQVADRIGWTWISRLTILQLSGQDHQLIDHQRQIRDLLPWVYRTQ